MFFSKLTLVLVFTAAAVMCDQKCNSEAQCPEGQVCVGDSCVSVDDPTCPENMHFVKCGSTCHETCDYKPTICNKMCFIGCICDDGYVLNAERKCIKREDCPQKINETVDACRSVKCAAGYECSKGTCVLRHDCPLVSMVPPSSKCIYLPETDSRGCLTPRLVCSEPELPAAEDAENQCGENAYMSNCTNFCPPIHCGNLDQKIVCFSLRCGPPGCVCKNGFVFKSNDKSLGCVKRADCSKEEDPVVRGSVPSSKVCGANEHYTNCGTACEPSCKVPEPSICTLQCIVDVCQCNTGFYRHETKGCVPRDQC